MAILKRIHQRFCGLVKHEKDKNLVLFDVVEREVGHDEEMEGG